MYYRATDSVTIYKIEKGAAASDAAINTSNDTFVHAIRMPTSRLDERACMFLLALIHWGNDVRSATAQPQKQGGTSTK